MSLKRREKPTFELSVESVSKHPQLILSPLTIAADTAIIKTKRRRDKIIDELRVLNPATRNIPLMNFEPGEYDSE